LSLEATEIDLIAERTATLLAEKKRAHWVDPEIHAEHHSWTSLQITAQDRRREFWEGVRQKIVASAAIWALPILIGAIALVSWEWFIGRVREAAGG